MAHTTSYAGMPFNIRRRNALRDAEQYFGTREFNRIMAVLEGNVRAVKTHGTQIINGEHHNWLRTYKFLEESLGMMAGISGPPARAMVLTAAQRAHKTHGGS